MDKKLKSVTNTVIEILRESEQARDSDELLYVMVCRRYNSSTGMLPFSFVMESRKTLNIPSYETVSRCRRKVQEQFPDLVGSKRVKQARQEETGKYVNYSKAVL